MFNKVDKYFFGELGSKHDRVLFYGTLLLSLALCVFAYTVTGVN